MIMVDYSKWDGLVLSDDSEDEAPCSAPAPVSTPAPMSNAIAMPALRVEKAQKKEDKEAVEEKERFVVEVDADVETVLGLLESMPSEVLSGVGAVSSMKGDEMAVPVHNVRGFSHKGSPKVAKTSSAVRLSPCAHCLTMMSKWYRCGGCKIAVYCGRTCQKAAWPQHKKMCKASGGQENPTLLRAKSGVQSMIDALHRHVDVLLPMQKYVQKQYQQHGKGILVIPFKTIKECEDAAYTLVLTGGGRGKGSSGTPGQLPAEYVTAAHPKSQAMEAHAWKLVETYNPEDSCVVKVTFAPSADGLPYVPSQVLILPFRNPHKVGFKRKPVAQKASEGLRDFMLSLCQDAAFAPCRAHLRHLWALCQRYPCGPCLLELTSIFKEPGGKYEMADLPRLLANPDLLRCALEVDLQMYQGRTPGIPRCCAFVTVDSLAQSRVPAVTEWLAGLRLQPAFHPDHPLGILTVYPEPDNDVVINELFSLPPEGSPVQ